MKLVLVHGWGFHSGVWDKLLPLLEGHETHCIDLGFVRGGPRASNDMPADSLCIGHSFGVMWLLKHGPRPVRGLVSIAGFDCLHKHVPGGVLETMREGMRSDPRAQMKSFAQNGGFEGLQVEGELDNGGLRGGLDWISTWDEGEALKNLGAPVMALAARNDRVVRKEASEAIWGNGVAALHWHEDAGHILPLTVPDWCAHHINQFADDIES
jgi:pimeloyl-[acyl-carrier protein] methyl ester esterase